MTASLISLSGDWIFSIGMMFSVYAITGSALASGAIVFTALLPHLLLGSVAGVAGRRARCRRRAQELTGDVSIDYTADPISVLRRTRISVG